MVTRLFRATTMVLVLGLASVCCAQDVWFQDLESARNEAQRRNAPLLLHFYADWCVPCQKMERSVLNQPKVKGLLQNSVVGFKINVDAHPELARRFEVDHFPTDVFIEPDGKGLLSHTGFQEVEEYSAMILRAATRYTDLVAAREVKPRTPQSNPAESTELASQSVPKPMLDGYSPVTLWKNRRWEQGSPQFKVNHKGQIYLLVSEAEQREFTNNPDRYVPRFLGCDPVVVWETDRAVPGLTTWAAFYDEELYLFSSAESRKQFRANPDKYTKTRVVLNVEDIETVLR